MNYRRHNIWTVVAVLALLGLQACTKSSEEPTTAQLVGVYTIVSGERNGAALDPHELDATITITDNMITAYDKERNETFTAAYTLQTDQSPWHITMTSAKAPETGVVSKGLVQAEQGRVKLVYALPDGPPPTDFKTGEHQQMFVLAKQESGQG
jgi:uncharacterized protein (TIGR03067 family)